MAAVVGRLRRGADHPDRELHAHLAMTRDRAPPREAGADEPDVDRLGRARCEARRSHAVCEREVVHVGPGVLEGHDEPIAVRHVDDGGVEAHAVDPHRDLGGLSRGDHVLAGGDRRDAGRRGVHRDAGRHAQREHAEGGHDRADPSSRRCGGAAASGIPIATRGEPSRPGALRPPDTATHDDRPHGEHDEGDDESRRDEREQHAGEGRHRHEVQDDRAVERRDPEGGPAVEHFGPGPRGSRAAERDDGQQVAERARQHLHREPHDQRAEHDQRSRRAASPSRARGAPGCRAPRPPPPPRRIPPRGSSRRRSPAAWCAPRATPRRRASRLRRSTAPCRGRRAGAGPRSVPRPPPEVRRPGPAARAAPRHPRSSACAHAAPSATAGRACRAPSARPSRTR